VPEVLESVARARGRAGGLHPLSLSEVSTPRSLYQPLVGGSREVAAGERAVSEVPQGPSGRPVRRPNLHSLQVRLLPVPGVRGPPHGIRTLADNQGFLQSFAEGKD